jgi:hypothetical protein
LQVFDTIITMLEALVRRTSNPWVHALHYWALTQKLSLQLHTRLIMTPHQPGSPAFGTEEWYQESEYPTPWDQVRDRYMVMQGQKIQARLVSFNPDVDNITGKS